MKLYTEEQVRFIAKAIYNRDFDPAKSPTELVKELTPIELPSDEEIKNKSFNKFTQSNARTCFEEGAKWMKSKILGNNHLGGITY